MNGDDLEEKMNAEGLEEELKKAYRIVNKELEGKKEQVKNINAEIKKLQEKKKTLKPEDIVKDLVKVDTVENMETSFNERLDRIIVGNNKTIDYLAQKLNPLSTLVILISVSILLSFIGLVFVVAIK